MSASSSSSSYQSKYRDEAEALKKSADSRPSASSSASTEDYSDGSEPPSDKEDTEPQTETDSDRDEIVLSVYWRGGKLGAAVYSLQNPVVFVLNDVEDDFLLGFKTLRSVIMQVQPTQVVTCKSMPLKFILLLNFLLGGHEYVNNTISEEQLHHFKLVGNLHTLPDAEFRNQNSLRQVLNLRLPEEPQDWQEEEHNQYIRSIIDTSNNAMVNALARLIKYLNSNLAGLCLSHDQNPILAIRVLCMEDQVWVNREIHETLGIFSHNPHPSLFKWTSNACIKEGLSVYGLFNRCHSKLGSKFMRAALMQPVCNQAELNKRHEVVTFCIQPSNEDVVNKMRSCIGKVQSITGMLPRLFAGQASVPQWKSLKKTNHNVLLIREICLQHATSVSFFEKAQEVISEDLYRIDQLMERIIDFQTSEQLRRFVVLPGVYEELDEMKQIHSNLPTIMSKVGLLELPDLPDHIEDCSVLYIPELGFLISIPMWKSDMTEEEMALPGFKFKFIANKMIHYKTPRCRELDNSLGDISLRIRQLELKIMLRLTQYIQQYINTLVDSLSFVGELDCLIAFADVAKEFGYVKPILTSKREILITEGRHPLQEHSVSNFVPNDTCSDKTNGFVKLLTGPNASGKSVYLKQVAMIAFLAHTGSFVPAKKAAIGVLDHIHTIIQTKESAALQLSAFMIDLRQMSTVMTISTKSSLVVIDEFGKGTYEVDGLALLSAYVRDVMRLGPDKCPQVFISTHFHQLVDIVDHSFIKTYILDYIVSEGELIYLFQLKRGRIDSSLAFDVARAKGFSRNHTNRAREILCSSTSAPVDHKKMHLSSSNESCMEWFLNESLDEDEDIAEVRKKFQS